MRSWFCIYLMWEPANTWVSVKLIFCSKQLRLTAHIAVESWRNTLHIINWKFCHFQWCQQTNRIDYSINTYFVNCSSLPGLWLFFSQNSLVFCSTASRDVFWKKSQVFKRFCFLEKSSHLFALTGLLLSFPTSMIS